MQTVHLGLFSDLFISIQDNFILHTVRIIKDRHETKTIQRMKNLVCSGDLHPIQHLEIAFCEESNWISKASSTTLSDPWKAYVRLIIRKGKYA